MSNEIPNSGPLFGLSKTLSKHAKVIDYDEDTVIFSHRNVVMSIYFQGASWLLSLPLLLRVKVDNKLFKTLVVEASTGGDGSWSIGRISEDKRTNLWQTKLFWTPNEDEIVHTFSSWSLGFRDSLGGLSGLDGSDASLHAHYSTLAFHKQIAWHGLDD